MHILKQLPAVAAVQFKQEDGDRLTVYVQAIGPFAPLEAEQFFRRQLAKDHPALDPESVTVKQVAQPVLTRSGKQALFIE